MHSVLKGLYNKIMHGLSHYAVLEKLPIVEKKNAAHCTALSPIMCGAEKLRNEVKIKVAISVWVIFFLHDFSADS